MRKNGKEKEMIKRKKECLLRKFGTFYLIVPTEGNQIRFREMISLNETGAFLWNLLEGERTKEELLSEMLSEYRIDRKTAEGDLEEFLNMAQTAGILDVSAVDG